MNGGEDLGRFNPAFSGRQRELEWLSERARGRGSPIVITGVGGVGKTTLLKQFLATVRTRRPPLVWTPRYNPDEAMGEISARIEELYRARDAPEIIAIDEAEAFGEKELNEITKRVLNFKAVRTLIFVSRQAPLISRAEVLRLEKLSDADVEGMLRHLLGADYPSSGLSGVAEIAGGNPLALTLLAELVKGRGPEEVAQLLRGEIYKLERRIIVPERKLLTDVKPRIIMVNEALVERLRREPQSIFDLPSRKFEELVAELLTDLGYEVELTPATRDGGKDMLAYMATPHGKLLCLVEAKRYRRDRTVGVELVRQLYGTLADGEASSAMMVTTSSFSPDARSFQQRHQYKLALRDYGHILQWIQGYGQR
ncbi:restriction endonuclease [Rhizobium leguminosarum]|uniref:restriction endonuclease n=1 Tax=Rhizobium leguminosarum TaxID=384 RepID=UPI001C8FF512|nr:restriction endonuclease [Rhizobium leguminosarum]MBY2935663.1 AAA family ATPase [Rhizobium leguminosarum]